MGHHLVECRFWSRAQPLFGVGDLQVVIKLCRGSRSESWAMTDECQEPRTVVNN